MNIILIAKHDWANLGYTFSECLKSIGINAVMVGKPLRIYRYPKSGLAFKHLEKYVYDADIIQFMHSQYIELPNLLNKKVFAFHGGDRYRHDYKIVNDIFNSIVYKSFIQTGDLIGLGAKNEVWMLPAVDTKNLFPDFKRVWHRKIVIGHFPSNSNVKGSEIINKAIARLKINDAVREKFEYRYLDNKVEWSEQINRILSCDIYIEQMKLGEWGVTALEAAALGRIVVTNFKSLNRYNKEYGKCGLVVANDEFELENKLIELLNMDDFAIDSLKHSSRKWVEKFHSYEAIGNRLLKEYIT